MLTNVINRHKKKQKNKFPSPTISFPHKHLLQFFQFSLMLNVSKVNKIINLFHLSNHQAPPPPPSTAQDNKCLVLARIHFRQNKESHNSENIPQTTTLESAPYTINCLHNCKIQVASVCDVWQV